MEREADEFLADHGMQLIARIATATVVPRLSVQPDGWTPQPNSCHENVSQWVDGHPGSKWVRGWLVFDQRPELFRLLGVRPQVNFLAHAAVMNSDGTLVDITPPPRPEAGTYPFLAHTGVDEEYDDLISRYFLARIIIYVDVNPYAVTFRDQ